MLINSIPGPVIGGISFLLYGMIGTSGIRILVEEQVDYGRSRNMAMTSVIFVTGLSGISVEFGGIQLSGMVLASCIFIARTFRGSPNRLINPSASW